MAFTSRYSLKSEHPELTPIAGLLVATEGQARPGTGARLSGVLSDQRTLDAARHAGTIAGGGRQTRHRAQTGAVLAGHDPQARLRRTRPDGRTTLVGHDRGSHHRQ